MISVWPPSTRASLPLRFLKASVFPRNWFYITNRILGSDTDTYSYLGAAADIISKSYLTADSFILTVESRHSAYIRNALAESPFPSPFDVPLAYNEVHTLAANVKSCPKTNPPRPFKAFPTLTASPNNPKTISVGTQITLFTDGYVRISVARPSCHSLYQTKSRPSKLRTANLRSTVSSSQSLGPFSLSKSSPTSLQLTTTSYQRNFPERPPSMVFSHSPS